MSYRIKQINNSLRGLLERILKERCDFQNNVLVTISSVETSSDLRYSKINISIYPEKESDIILSILNKNIKDIQQELNKRLNTKFSPKIEFILDESQKRAAEIEKLLDNTKIEKNL